MGTHPIFESDFDCLTDNGRLNLVMSLVSREATSIDAEYRHLLSDVLPKLQWFTTDSQNVVEATLICRDKRQNGTCGCIQRFITNRTDTRSDLNGASSDEKLTYIANLSFNSHRLKTERNPIAGRRYSDSFANHVNEHRSDLSRYKLCKKAIAAVLHCSLNFLYRDNNNKQKVVKKIEQIRATPCCEKQCLNKLCTKYPNQVGQWRYRLEQRDSKSEENRKVFFELRDHVLSPCMRAVGEITSLSKATLNNLSSKTPESGIKHALQGRRRQHSGQSRVPSIRLSASSLTSPLSSISPSISSPLSLESKHFDKYVPLTIERVDNPHPAHRDTVIRIKMEPDTMAEAAPSSSATTLPGEPITPTYRVTQPPLAVIRSEEIAPIVGPMRSRLNAINEDKEKGADIPPLQSAMLSTYMNEPVMNEPVMDSRQPSVHDLPAATVEVERRKRKKMPGLIALNSPMTEPENSPPLRMNHHDFPPGSPERKRTPAPIIYSMPSILNTPTITPNTPSNPTQAKNTPVDQRRVFFG